MTAVRTLTTHGLLLLDGRFWRVSDRYWRLSPFEGQPVQSACQEGPWRDVPEVDSHGEELRQDVPQRDALAYASSSSPPLPDGYS